MDRRSWAASSRDYAQRRPSQRRDNAASDAASDDLSIAQKEMTGISWDNTRVDFSRIRPSDVKRARHRFRSSLPDLIWNAAALEGNTFTLPEVRTLLDGVTVQGKRIEEEQQVLALSEGYSRLDELVGTGQFTLDKATSDELHSLIARHEAIESGHFRGEGSVSGGGSVSLASGGSVPGIPTAELAARWSRLVEYLARLEDPRERALTYFAAATRTQFYFDGNKRTTRLMMTGMLLRTGFDAVNIPYSRKLEFNVALDEMFTTDDATMLLAFLSTCTMPE